MNDLELLLGRWANFYIVTSAAAATLIGLLFVVITLVIDRGLEDTAQIRAYLTPTVVYFASVLIVAALLTFPNHTPLTATLCLCVSGIVGLVYSGFLLIARRRRTIYFELSDLVHYAGLPVAAYGLLVLGGILMLHDAQRGLTFVAVGMLSLLTIAIRNSWAIAVGLVSTRPGRH
jgi:hypothetical protein